MGIPNFRLISIRKKIANIIGYDAESIVLESYNDKEINSVVYEKDENGSVTFVTQGKVDRINKRAKK